VESDDTADSHNVDAGDADTEDRNVNGTDGTENRDVDDTDGKTENKIIDDWRLILVNSDNPIPDDYSFDLSSLDEFRKFDSRAIDDLKKLIEDCRREPEELYGFSRHTGTEELKKGCIITKSLST